ncbi:MAG: class I SAM-dependent methyltransferase [Schleiferiaceae bacterium]
MDSFFKEAILSFKTSGTIKPSSKYLIRACLKDIDFENAKNIIEFGTGDGCITSEILSRKRKSTNLYSFELNEKFFNHCRDRFNNEDGLHLIHGSALEFDQILKTQGIKKVDYFISSLPLSLFDKSTINSIIDKVLPYMDNDGIFIQYMYSFNKYNLMKNRFNKIAITMTLLNLPPAIIFKCTKCS